MQITFSAATDVGGQRERNEDSYLVDPELNLFVVADGMGGQAAGAVASKLAVNEVARVVRESIDVVEGSARAPGSAARQDILTVLERGVQTSCATIFRRGQAEQDKRGMGTTTSALLLAGDRGFIAHVGQSRIYLLREGQVHQLTEDHSLINELVRRGRVKREDVDSSPYARFKNVVTRAVGPHESVVVDTLDFEVFPGDHFLLCSDGLHRYLKNSAVPGILSAEDVAATAHTLVALSKSGGGRDDMTAVVVRLASDAAKEHTARAIDLANRMDVLKSMPLFKHLSYKEVMRLLNVTVVKDYDRGGCIIREGSEGEELFIILSGTVRLHKTEGVFAHLKHGAHFGEMALVDRSPRSASATAEEPSRLLVLRRDDFYEIIRNEPVLATKLLWSFVQALTDRLRKTTTDLWGARLEAHAEDLSEHVLLVDDSGGSRN